MALEPARSAFLVLNGRPRPSPWLWARIPVAVASVLVSLVASFWAEIWCLETVFGILTKSGLVLSLLGVLALVPTLFFTNVALRALPDRPFHQPVRLSADEVVYWDSSGTKFSFRNAGCEGQVVDGWRLEVRSGGDLHSLPHRVLLAPGNDPGSTDSGLGMPYRLEVVLGQVRAVSEDTRSPGVPVPFEHPPQSDVPSPEP